MKINKTALGIVLVLAFTMIPNSAFASSLFTVNSPFISSSKSLFSKPKISKAFLSNTLSASIGKVKKSSLISYQWIKNKEPIPGELNRSYEWKPTDCGQDIQVLVTVKEKRKKESSKLSSSYNPTICQYTTGDLPAWNSLYECGINDGIPSSMPNCSQYINGPPGSFWGFAYRKTVGQPWFRISLDGIDPSRVIGWKAEAKGLFHSYTRSLVMITKNEPTWACCDWTGTKFPSRTFPVPVMVSDEVIGLGADGAAYVGFNFYDPFGVSESLVVDTIRVTFRFK